MPGSSSGSDATLVARLAALDSCAVSDALDSLELPAAVAGLGALTIARKIAGPIRTVRLAPGRPPPGRNRHLGAAAIDAARPGDLIVVEHASGVACAGWGGLLSSGAQIRGVVGVIVDGPARDIDEARALQFPIYARAADARTARGRVYEVETGGPVTIADVPVRPGDIALADASGIVFVPRARADEVVQRAEDIAARERRMLDALRAGLTVSEVVAGDYESMLDRLE